MDEANKETPVKNYIPMTRKEFLKVFSGTGLGALLAACKPSELDQLGYESLGGTDVKIVDPITGEKKTEDTCWRGLSNGAQISFEYLGEEKEYELRDSRVNMKKKYPLIIRLVTGDDKKNTRTEKPFSPGETTSRYLGELLSKTLEPVLIKNDDETEIYIQDSPVGSTPKDAKKLSELVGEVFSIPVIVGMEGDQEGEINDAPPKSMEDVREFHQGYAIFKKATSAEQEVLLFLGFTSKLPPQP